MIRITVTPTCLHEDGFVGSGTPVTGRHLVITLYGVFIDGNEVLRRDRRAKRNRVPGHPWYAVDGSPAPFYTGFSIAAYEEVSR